MKTIEVPTSRAPVRMEVDVVVAGGGSAGVAAAVAAARAGAKTVLIERHGFLGGTMTATSLGGICGLYSLVDGEPVQMVFGMAEEVRSRLQSKGGTAGPFAWMKTASLPYDVYTLKTVFDDLVAEPNLTVFFHHSVTRTIVEEDRITHIVVRGQSDEWAIGAGVFVDATGDAELCASAGSAFEFIPETLQYPTAMFRMGGVDIERRVPRPELHRLLEKAVADGFELPRTAGGIYAVGPGIVHLNITRVAFDGRPPNPFDPRELTFCEFEGRRQIERYLEVFRRYVPGYENAFVIDTGAVIGLRETRRIIGDYVLTEEDVVQERKFPDAIACNCWPIEDHRAGRSIHWVWLSPGGYNHIPFSALIPRDLTNVIVAGRCLSATHEAQTAIRVTANCFSMGQAAGLAAAMAGADAPRSVPINLLQQRLEAHGVKLAPTAKST